MWSGRAGGVPVAAVLGAFLLAGGAWSPGAAAELPCLPSGAGVVACPRWTAAHEGLGWRAAFTPDAATVLVAQWGFVAQAYDATSGALRWTSRWPEGGWIHGAALSADGQRFHLAGFAWGVHGPQDRDVGVATFDAATGALLWVQRVHWGPGEYVEALATNPRTHEVYVAGGSSGVPFVAALDGRTGALRWDHLWKGADATRGHLLGLDVAPDGSRVYATGFAYRPGHGEDVLTVALDAATGALAWEARYDDPERRNNYAEQVRAAPSGDLVFVLGYRHDVAVDRDGKAPLLAYGARAGELRWAAEFPAVPGLRYGAQRGLAVSPAGDLVVQGGTGCVLPYETLCDFAVSAHEAGSGEVRWWALRDARPFSLDVAERVEFLAEGRGVLVAGRTVTGSSPAAHVVPPQDVVVLDPATGLTTWSASLGGRVLGLATSPQRVAVTGWISESSRGTALFDLPG